MDSPGSTATATSTTPSLTASPLPGSMATKKDIPVFQFEDLPDVLSAAAHAEADHSAKEEEEGEVKENDSKDQYALFKCPSSQSLTKESLLLLNLKNASEPLTQLTAAASLETSNFTTTPELTSSSSVTSFDESSEDYKAAHRLYSNSNSSIATIVQKFASSTSTLNLQSSEHTDTERESSIPKSSPALIDQLTATLSTTSLSSLTSNNDTTGTTTDTNSMKAPKRLKSSLKLPSLTRCKSMPSTKTVRFSSDLEKVKTFNEYAKPSSISLDNSPEQSPPSSRDYELSGNPKAFFELKNSNSGFYNSSSDSDESEEDYFTYKSKLRHSKWKMKNQSFDLFSTYRTFPTPPVKLTSMTIKENVLSGTVEVGNFSFEKYVEVKFTTDGWNSIYLVTGSYDRSLDSSRDQFKFETDLNKSIMMNSSRMLKKNSSNPIKVELCVKYVAGGSSVFYDNNNSCNYRFDLVNYIGENKKSRKHQPHRSPSLDGNFVSAKINEPPKVLSGGRYFSDDTDYFNYTSTEKMKWLGNNFQSSFSTTPASSSSSVISSAKSSSNSSTETLTKTAAPSIKPPSSTQGGTESYSEFLKKYCFFKSDDRSGDANESVFIR